MANRLFAVFVAATLSLVLSAPAWAELPDFTGLVERVSPAVVNVSASKQAGTRFHGDGQPDEEEMQELFRRFFGQPGGPGGTPPVPRDRLSMGTGFLISADGYLLTNHHVIDGADEVYVRLADRRELKAKVVGSDEQSDVALLKIEASGLPAVVLGDSSKVRPGQWVVAIGSPFGFDHSVTAGIVSAVGRTPAVTGQRYVPFIQTDVAINRGNSGGPLLDIDGRVVGINSQIFSNTGGFMGVSFAIPVEVAMNAVDQLKAKGYVARGLLGVNIQPVTRDLAQGLDLPRSGGALVSGFSEDSSAKRAGVQIRDVILAFNGTEIDDASELPPLVGAATPGSMAKLKVFRDGKTLELSVKVAELPRDAVASSSEGDSETAKSNAIGLQVEDLTDEQRDALGLEAGEGVVVARVTNTAAARAGIQAGDVILMVGRTAVGSAAAFEAAVAKLKSDAPVLLLVRRGDQSQFRTIAPAVGE